MTRTIWPSKILSLHQKSQSSIVESATDQNLLKSTPRDFIRLMNVFISAQLHFTIHSGVNNWFLRHLINHLRAKYWKIPNSPKKSIVRKCLKKSGFYLLWGFLSKLRQIGIQFLALSRHLMNQLRVKCQIPLKSPKFKNVINIQVFTHCEVFEQTETDRYTIFSIMRGLSAYIRVHACITIVFESF